MSTYLRASGAIIELLLFTTVVGLLVRNRWRVSLFFVLYVLFGLSVDGLVLIWPHRFYVPGVWLSIELAGAFLKLGIVLEIALRTFQRFQGARPFALLIGLLITGATCLAMTAVPLGSTAVAPVDIAITEFVPRLVNGVVWLMAATLGVARWYRVPVHPLHAVILTGLAIYLAICAALYHVFPTLAAVLGPDAAHACGIVIEASSFQAVAVWWAYTVSQRDGAAAIFHVETLPNLQLRGSSSCA